MKKLFIVFFAFLFVVTVSCSNSADKGDGTAVATLSNGVKVTGLYENGVNNFRGIKYGEADRFAPPEMYEYTKDFTADEFGNICPQLNGNEDYTQSEDCLNLNISVPKGTKAGDDLPVYIFIHGGYFMWGNGNEYDGSSFAENGICYISINYRLNVFGYYASQMTFDEYGTTGNFGTLDQILAVKWVYENIEGFGGDPETITVGGESAGAYAASALLYSPEVQEGLIDRVILESGNALLLPELSLGTSAEVESTITRSYEYAKTVSVEKQGGDGIDGILRNATTEELLSEVDDTSNGFYLKNIDLTNYNPKILVPEEKLGVFMKLLHRFQPTLDGKVLPKNIYNARMKKADVLIMHTEGEGISFVTEKLGKGKLKEYIKIVCGDKKGAAIYKYYFGKDDEPTLEKTRDFVALLFFVTGQNRISRSANNAYVSNFAYGDNGSPHASEVIDVFYMKKLVKGKVAIKLAKKLNTYFSNFIKNGNLYKDAPQYNEETYEVLKVTDKFEVTKEQYYKDIDKFEEILFK